MSPSTVDALATKRKSASFSLAVVGIVYDVRPGGTKTLPTISGAVALTTHRVLADR